MDIVTLDESFTSWRQLYKEGFYWDCKTGDENGLLELCNHNRTVCYVDNRTSWGPYAAIRSCRPFTSGKHIIGT